MQIFSKLSELNTSRGRSGSSSRQKSKTRRKVSYDTLEPRQMMAVVINEFVASNTSGILDDNGNSTDWIELLNTGNQTINLSGYSLTDDASDPSKFVFANQSLFPGQHLVVFAGDDANVNSGNDIYTGFGLSSSGEYLGLFNPSGALLSEFSAGGADFPVQLPDVSYGLINDGTFSQPSYFSTPTPGSPNVNPVAEIVDRVQATVEPGFYDSAFNVTLFTATPGAVVFYTTDGSTPTAFNNENNFTQTSSAISVTITGTTTLRAVALKSGALSVVDRTWTYLFLDDILDQDQSAAPGFPSSNSTVNGQVFDYGFDPDVIAIEGEQAVRDALLSIPTVSITTDADNLFDPQTGIYVNALESGIDYERPASVELINPDGSEGFQVNAGLRIRGGFSRQDDNPKHSFRVLFRGEYGDSELNYPLHGEDGADTFDRLDFRTAQNYSWSREGDASGNFINEYFSRLNQGATGELYTRSTWVHFYVNGQYFGIFQTQERVDANFGVSYLGGEVEDFDVIRVDAGPGAPRTIVAADGNLDAFERLAQETYALDSDNSTPNFVNNEAYYRVQGLNVDGTRNPDYEVLLDVDNLVGYITEILYSGNFDAPITRFGGNDSLNNWQAIRDRTGDEGFKYFVHDAEHSLRSVDINRNGPFNDEQFDLFESFNPQTLHQRLMANAEYRLAFADSIQNNFFNDGPYTPENLIARWDAAAAEVGPAIIAESARWGDASSRNNGFREDNPLLRSDWEAAIANVRNNILVQRHAVTIAQLQNTFIELQDNNGNFNIPVDAPLFPSIDAPDFLVDGIGQHGGEITAGSTLDFSSDAGTIYYTTDGTDPRLTGGGINPNAIAVNSSTTTSNIFGFGSNWRFEDSGTDLGTAWRNSGFNDANWNSGVGEFGFGQNTTDTVVSFGNDANNKHTTTYFRKTFNVDAGSFTSVDLSVLRDDGIVIYLNGTEIGRDNISGNVNYQTFADSAIGGASETTPVNFTIPASLLLPGANTLAIEVHQVNLTSSDLTFDAQLSVTSQTSPTSPFIFNASSNVQARTFSNGEWSALSAASFVIPAAQSDLRISEINYNPADPTPAEIAAGFIDNDDFEFIELFNPSTSGTINLSGVQFSDGVTFEFGNVDLLPGERAVVVEDIDAFIARYGDSATILGEWTGGLNNGGEELTLVDSGANEIQSVDYGDDDPFSSLADGNGFSLVLNDPVNTPVEELGKYYSWRASSELGGTPGEASASPTGVVINEILANTDAGQSDAIELFNPTNQAIDVGLFFLSDSVESPFKFRIPAGTVIPVGGYVVYDESDFNPTPGNPGVNDFAFSSGGDDVLLSRAVVVAGSVSPFVEDFISFGATFSGDSLGRTPDGTGRLTRLASNSFGSVNGDAQVGPLVISEINYHPEDPSAAALAIDPLLTDNDLEYIEIANPTSSSIDLTDWRIRGEADFDFAAGTSLAAGAAIVVVSFDPSLAINANKLAAFQAHYSLASSVTIVGGLNDSLSNSTGRISLQQPDAPDLLGAIPHVVVDELVYDDLSPWANADGNGQVLERDDLTANAALSTTWVAAAPTPGAFEDEFLIADVNLDGIVSFLDIAPFIALLTNGDFQLEADVNQDGNVNFLDISFFIAELTNQ